MDSNYDFGMKEAAQKRGVQREDQELQRCIAAAQAAFAALTTIRADRKTLEAHEAALALSLRQLVEILPEEHGAELRHLLNATVHAVAPPQPRSGTVYEMVIAALKRMPSETWTATKLKRVVEEQAGSVNQRTIANQLGYLAKTGRLTRVSQGHYVVRDLGAGLVTSDEIQTGDYRGDCEAGY